MIDSLAQAPSATLSAKVASSPVEQLSASSVTSPVKLRSLESWSHSIAISEGAVKVGAVLSSTVIVCTKVVVLSQSSTSVQVLVIIDSLAQAPSATLSAKVASKAPEQASVSSVTSPVIERSLGSWSHSIAILLGTVNVGGVVSSIVSVALKVVALPQSSVIV